MPPVPPPLSSQSPRVQTSNRLRSQSLVIEDSNLHLKPKRPTIQRQESVDVVQASSGTILEETSSSSCSSDDNKSYLSVKRESLKKKLRMSTIISTDEQDTDHNTSNNKELTPEPTPTDNGSPFKSSIGRQTRVTSL